MRTQPQQQTPTNKILFDLHANLKKKKHIQMHKEMMREEKKNIFAHHRHF